MIERRLSIPFDGLGSLILQALKQLAKPSLTGFARL